MWESCCSFVDSHHPLSRCYARCRCYDVLFMCVCMCTQANSHIHMDLHTRTQVHTQIVSSLSLAVSLSLSKTWRTTWEWITWNNVNTHTGIPHTHKTCVYILPYIWKRHTSYWWFGKIESNGHCIKILVSLWKQEPFFSDVSGIFSKLLSTKL